MAADPTHFVLCRQDRFLPEAWLRRVVNERLGLVPDGIESGHCAALSRPRELAALLDAYIADRDSDQTTLMDRR
jgi:hypothetical protein